MLIRPTRLHVELLSWRETIRLGLVLLYDGRHRLVFLTPFILLSNINTALILLRPLSTCPAAKPFYVLQCYCRTDICVSRYEYNLP